MSHRRANPNYDPRQSVFARDPQVRHLVELLLMSVNAGDDEGLLSALRALNAHVRAARKS